MRTEFQVVFIEGPSEGTRRNFVADEVVIGREPECDLVLIDPGLSRRHCRIVRDAHGWFIDDLGSRNGVRVNGELIGRQRLQRDDRITVGVSVFTFTDEPVRRITRIDDSSLRHPKKRS